MRFDTHHLHNVCMTYTEHARLSLSLAWLFFQGFACAVVHAFVRMVLASTSTDCVIETTRRIRNAGYRGATSPRPEPP